MATIVQTIRLPRERRWAEAKPGSYLGSNA